MPKLNSYEIEQFSNEDRFQNGRGKKKPNKVLSKHDEDIVVKPTKKPIVLRKK